MILMFPSGRRRGAVITQAELQEVLAAPSHLLAEEPIRRALIEGAKVEPGPILAYLIRYKPTARQPRMAYKVVIRPRRGARLAVQS